MIRSLFACAIAAIIAAPAAWSADTVPAQPAVVSSVDDATRIAAEIIQQRARDSEAGGRAALASQLNALAKGLLSGKVTLYDASLVMQIALADAPAKAATASALSQPTIDPKVSARQATAILDGVPPPEGKPITDTAPPVPGVPASAPSATGATAPSADPGKGGPKPLTTKVYAVDNGSDGRMNRAIIGAGTKNGVIAGNRFAIRRNNLPVAMVSVVLVKDALSYCTLVPGSLADPRDDVKEGDQAVLAAPAATGDVPAAESAKSK